MAQTGSPYTCGSRQIRRNQMPCGVDDPYEKARINDYAAVLKGTIPDTVKQSGYKGLVTAILAAEGTCAAIVMRDISGAYDGGAHVKGKAGGRVKERTVSRTNTVTIADLGISGNEDFWDDMAANASNYDHFFFGATKVYPAESDPEVTAKNPITDDPDANVEGEGTFVFSRQKLLKGYDYDRTPLLKANAPFLAFTGLTAGSGTATVQGETVTTTPASPFSIAVAFTAQPVGAVLEYHFAPKQAIPAGLEMLSNGTLTASVGVAAGRYVLAVQASNPCGVLGEVTITLVVA